MLLQGLNNFFANILITQKMLSQGFFKGIHGYKCTRIGQAIIRNFTGNSKA